MNRNYPKPTEIRSIAAWAEPRQTDTVVAAAIFAIASRKRPAQNIWDAPTTAEWDNVAMAIQEFISHGDFEASADGRYHWGSEIVMGA